MILFFRLAGIAELESNLAQPKEYATLWETEEQAIRYLIEDGKLNLCLRCMINYKEYQRNLLKVNSDFSVSAFLSYTTSSITYAS